MNITIKLLGIVGMLVLGICLLASPTRSETDAGGSVKEADLAFCKAVQERGLEGWMSYFAEDAVIGPSDPPVRGKDAVRSVFSKIFAREKLDFEWVPTAGEVFPAGTLGYTSGHAHMSYMENGARKERTSRYVTIWEKQTDKTWKVIADFGAPDPSPAEAPVSCK